jgi:hypothetical protein
MMRLLAESKRVVVAIRGRNGPGWADESQPMGYQTLAQPTHGRLI